MKFSAKCRTFHLLDSSVILACQANQEMARYLTSNTTSTDPKSQARQTKTNVSNLLIRFFGQSWQFLRPDLDDYWIADAKKKEPHIKKPLNAFMIYMKV